MDRHQSAFHLACLRHRLLVWVLLLNFCCSLFPAVSLAQQPSATIRSLTGNVMVSGRKAGAGTVLYAGDSITTWDDSSVLLRLSDGSEIQIGENTQININDLSQTPAGGRVSRLTMLVGWLRATLSPDHQQADSAFTVDTPNAQIGTRFSEPSFTMYVSPDQQESWIMADSVELEVTNRATGEMVVLAIGTSAIVKGMMIQVFPRILDPFGGPEGGSGPEEQPPSSGGAEAGGGMGTGAKILLGTVALAAAGGAATMAVLNNLEEEEEEEDDGEITGKCNELMTAGSDTPESHVIELGKPSGTFLFEYTTYGIEDRMIVEYEGSVLFDTECVGVTGQSRRISYSGKSSKVTVRVIPNCRGTSGTLWEFVVNCP